MTYTREELFTALCIWVAMLELKSELSALEEQFEESAPSYCARDL